MGVYMIWAKTIQWLDDRVRLIDQRKLPLEEVYVDIKTPEEMHNAIKRMVVRGAPAIGVAAGYGIALAALENCDRKYLLEKIELIESARPTAYNLFYVGKRMRKLLERKEIKPALFVKEAIQIHKEDRELTEKLGEYGSALLPKRSQCMTICNAGALATGGIGTALAVFYKAKDQGKEVSVFVPETRPFLQGARLSSWELKKNGIETILIADNAISYILKTEEIDAVFTGADRIARNGDTANKIGTYGLALSSREHHTPFFVVAPRSTLDLTLNGGNEIPIEERPGEEVKEFRGIQIAPRNIEVRNPAFDVTPNYLITGIVTEKGVIYPPFRKGISLLE